MAYLTNLPPGCTSAMIDALCDSEWECAGCGEPLTEDELCECDGCGLIFCKRDVREVEHGTGYLCFDCPEQFEAAQRKAA